AGFLNGVAQVISAEGQLGIQNQQARLLQEQVRQEQVETRRRIWEQWRYEQDNLPTPEEIRARQWQAELDRIRNNPSAVDISSGEALNVLLRQIQKLQSEVDASPSIWIDPAILPKISVTDGTSFGQGILSQGPELTWPVAIKG